MKKNDEKKKMVELILRYMDKNNLSQIEMAEMFNVKQPTLSGWLNDAHGITKNHIERIKHICGDINESNLMVHGNGNCVNSHNVNLCMKSIEEFRAGLISSLIDADIPPEALKIVLQIVKNQK